MQLEPGEITRRGELRHEDHRVVVRHELAYVRRPHVHRHDAKGEGVLRYLDETPEHLRWKREGFSSRFERLVDLGSIEPQLRMAVKLAHGCERSCRCGGRMRAPGEAE
jgi:hypothetical protein